MHSVLVPWEVLTSKNAVAQSVGRSNFIMKMLLAASVFFKFDFGDR